MGKGLLKLIRFVGKLPWQGIVGLCLIAIGAIGALIWMNMDNHIGIERNERIDITPTQIQSIRRIGQWEFLAIKDEELVDTIDRGFFSDKELVRIYYGTVRLGIDLQQTEDDWIEVKDSVVTATLPPIRLLDRNIIDEAQTRSFFESGSWTSADREALYQRAYQKMIDRCMTEENIATAEENAREQFAQLLHSMGFKKVKVKVERGK